MPGGCRVYIQFMYSVNPKVSPWQMVRNFKCIGDQVVFRGELALKKCFGAGFFSPMAIRCSQGEENWQVVQQFFKSKADRERNFVS
ncbi:MAG: hypothetical protein NPIRA03_18890 [Nitrospirales bacterium]|nr:MAG: hypothetical protein NPIRA03_18890 [Nitrospirales bacterium]